MIFGLRTFLLFAEIAVKADDNPFLEKYSVVFLFESDLTGFGVTISGWKLWPSMD